MNKIIKRQESPSWSSSWRPLTLMALEANKDETGWPGTPADGPRPPKLKKTTETEFSTIKKYSSPNVQGHSDLDGPLLSKKIAAPSKRVLA